MRLAEARCGRVDLCGPASLRQMTSNYIPAYVVFRRTARSPYWLKPDTTYYMETETAPVSTEVRFASTIIPNT